MPDELKQYAHLPLKQLPNRVWRTYQGGALIDRWKKNSPENDGNLPEEWIMSTISARGKNRPVDEGLSLIRTPKDIIPLDTLISSDLDLFIGERLANKFGTPGVLIKMLDSNERLTIQVHPDKEYARARLNSDFGKTESWYVLDVREINGEYEMKGNGSFFVGVVYSGEGSMSLEGETYSFTQGDEIFFSAAIERITFKSEQAARILLCYPPL